MSGATVSAKVGIGVVSFAHGHANAYCQRMLAYEDVNLVACWDDNAERGRSASEKYGMRYTAHVEDLLDDPTIQAVIVTCETNRHAGNGVGGSRSRQGHLVPEAHGLDFGRVRPHEGRCRKGRCTIHDGVSNAP